MAAQTLRGERHKSDMVGRAWMHERGCLIVTSGSTVERGVGQALKAYPVLWARLWEGTCLLTLRTWDENVMA